MIQMDEYKILKGFRDIHTKEKYVADSEIELSEERAAEINENLKDKGVFIEKIKTPKDPDNAGKDKFDREAAKERLKDLGVEFNGNAKNEALQQLLEENEETEEQEEVEEGK